MIPRVLVLDSPYSEEPVEQACLPELAVERTTRDSLPERMDDVVGLIVDVIPIEAGSIVTPTPLWGSVAKPSAMAPGTTVASTPLGT